MSNHTTSNPESIKLLLRSAITMGNISQNSLNAMLSILSKESKESSDKLEVLVCVHGIAAVLGYKAISRYRVSKQEESKVHKVKKSWKLRGKELSKSVYGEDA